MSAAPIAPHPWVQQFLDHLREVRGLSEETVRTYAKGILDFRRRLDPVDLATVGLKDADRYLFRLSAAGLARNTRRVRLAAVRSLYEFLATRNYVPSNPLKLARAPDQKWLDRIPIFSEKEIVSLITTSRPLLPRQRREPEHNFARRQLLNKLKELRDTALLGLSYNCAFRAAEPGLLARSDYRVQPGPGKSLRRIVVLRGAKWASEPVTCDVDNLIAGFIDRYLLELDRQGIRHPALFPPLSTRKGQDDGGVSAAAVRNILRSRVEAAGIEPRERHISPHMLRYSRATHLHDLGHSPAEIAKLLRHRSIETTMRYIRLGTLPKIQRSANAALPWNRIPAVDAVLGRGEKRSDPLFLPPPRRNKR